MLHKGVSVILGKSSDGQMRMKTADYPSHDTEDEGEDDGPMDVKVDGRCSFYSLFNILKTHGYNKARDLCI